MQNFSPSDLKTVLHSKRANLYYLERCRVLVNGGRVEYVTDEGKNFYCRRRSASPVTPAPNVGSPRGRGSGRARIFR